jgi:hypothetical protein
MRAKFGLALGFSLLIGITCDPGFGLTIFLFYLLFGDYL